MKGLNFCFNASLFLRLNVVTIYFLNVVFHFHIYTSEVLSMQYSSIKCHFNAFSITKNSKTLMFGCEI